MTKVICRLCRKKYANKGLWHVCFVDFVSVSLELLQCNLELKNSLKTLSYHFDFYVGEKYMECLLVDFSDYNQWSIGWGNPIISDDRLWNLNRFPPLWEYGDFLRFFINALARLKTWTIEKTRFATKGNCINIPYTTTLQNDDCTIILAKTMFAWQSGHSTSLYKHLFSKCSGRSAFFTKTPHSGRTQGTLRNSQPFVWAY